MSCIVRRTHGAQWPAARSFGGLNAPALLMGAASVDLPTIGVSGGPMLRGVHCGKYVGSGTNTISMSEQLRAGEITLDEYHDAEANMNRSHGHCMTMGTASTMACMTEALGVGMPGGPYRHSRESSVSSVRE
jgi:dihydroxyacid dehydratase/phosphogluconate dehydratase